MASKESVVASVELCEKKRKKKRRRKERSPGPNRKAISLETHFIGNIYYIFICMYI